MPQSQDFLTTRMFAEKAGVSTGTVSKWLRSGKIIGQKKNGIWRIAAAEMSKIAGPSQTHSTDTPQTKAASPPEASRSSASCYSVEDFSRMTYLTEYGVRLWLKTGRLIGTTDDLGNPAVAAASLDRPDVKRLLR